MKIYHNEYRKCKNPKISYIKKKTTGLSKIFKEESIGILKILGLLNIEKYQNDDWRKRKSRI